MAHSLHKGQRAERDVIGKLQPILDYVWGRVGLWPPKLERRGLGLVGQDISGVSWVSLEIKHREASALPTWWRQAVEQSLRFNGERSVPVLVYKRNNVAWRVRLPGFASDVPNRQPIIVDIDWDTFEQWFAVMAFQEMEKEIQAKGLKTR